MSDRFYKEISKGGGAGGASPIDIKFKLDGGPELGRAFRKLGEKVSKKVARAAVRSAANPWKTAAKRHAPRETGTLAESLGVKTARYSGVFVAIVGPRKGFRRDVLNKYGSYEVRDPVKYAHLVENGTRHSAAQPFMRLAFDLNRDKVKSRFVDRMWAGIERETAKLKVKSG